MSDKKRPPFFERLSAGLADGIAHVRGEVKLKVVEHAEPAPEIDGTTLAAIRAQTSMSQLTFARMLNVSTKTVQSWEQGSRKPSHASQRLLQIFAKHPELVCEVVGLPPVSLTGISIVGSGTKRRKMVVKS
ncbi:MAG: helix-turn-helix domain-containing protein [Planctomycetota bacterium]|nr:helix-turn-helix domain-containing protein [Planctomycetota bacterium]